MLAPSLTALMTEEIPIPLHLLSHEFSLVIHALLELGNPDARNLALHLQDTIQAPSPHCHSGKNLV